MKYWRGYLVAAIIAACSWGLEEFAKSHSQLVDMIYPYVSRMAQTYLTGWSAGVDFCLWQVLLIALGVLILASAVLMVVLKWNPIQWFGWVLAAASIVVLLNTGIYGLNEYAGPISEDLRLSGEDYTLTEVGYTANHHLTQANKLGSQLAMGSSQAADLNTLNELAADGFRYLTEQEFKSIFAGSTDPVKTLSWADFYTKKGVDGLMVGITGEAAVNPQTPQAALPFAICEQMARRMCISGDDDAKFAAFLASRSNEALEFQYAAHLMAYRACYQLLSSADKATGSNTAEKLKSQEESVLTADMALLDQFYGAQMAAYTEDLCGLLVSLYIQEQILPLQKEEEILFDPMDETQVDLSGIVNAGA